ncbi:MAG: hypothetical protein A3F12_06890 [Gammaproteobacteria bacterium RIFCSPHIGHO2_12_FULL_38_14]|nr:MAG: hypothetical protein A3F12_06890 [Gammaproteobacteria bacterium RIFCSPHIGHO2_12_FULL_38_14]
MADQDALTLIFLRNAFYRRLYHFTLLAFVLSLVAIAGLIWMLVFLILNPTQPLYFATDKVTRFIRTVSVQQPNMPTADVIAWTIEAVQSAYSYNFVNYRSQLQDAQKYFTRYGWTNYMQALTASNNLLALTQRKMVVLATVIDQPKIIVTGILGGSYAWRFEMPMLVTYLYPPYDDTSRFSNPLQITVIVQRQPELESYQGLGILQIIGGGAQVQQGGIPSTISNKPR